MAMLRENLRAIAPANWAPVTIHGLVNAALETRADPEVVARTCSLILAVIGNGGDDELCSLEAVKTHLPDESRDDVLTILQFHFTAIRELLKETIEDISSVLDVVIQRLALPAKEEMTASATPLRTPGPVPHTWMSDDLIPIELKTRFAHQVAALEKNVPSGQKDWQPVSDGQVLNLVDPLLYCGVVSQTKRLPQSAAKKLYGSPLEHMHANMFAVAKTKLSGPKAKSTKLFQWLPCEVDIDEQDEGGNATILTYINNLYPATFAGLYDSIQSIFTQFVPLFETVLSSLDDEADARMAMDLYKHGGNSLACLPNLAPPGLFETSEPQFSLKGSRCQVIIKLTEIHLTPQKPEYPGGAWHNDGTDSERIIATGVYYFGSDNITTTRTSFRIFVNVPHFDEDANVGAGLAYGLHAGQLPVQYLGGVSTAEDRCVVFPNIYQHKVEPFRLADPTKPGVCKVLTFFLVDPSQNPIASTAVVQQQEWIDLAREPQSKRARVAATVLQQAKDLSREGLSMEEAKKNRIELLKARTSIQLQEAGNNDYVAVVAVVGMR